MTQEERAAVYLLVSVLEESANKVGRDGTSLNVLSKLKEINKSKVIEPLRLFRNCVVHHPLNYSECYKILNKSSGIMRKGFIFCGEYSGIAGEADIKSAFDLLFKFYKENK